MHASLHAAMVTGGANSPKVAALAAQRAVKVCD
jgi:hypothetical protein